MNVNSVQNISFKSSVRTRDYSNALLMLHGQEDINDFKKAHEITVKADSLDTNPFTAIGYKFYKTVKYLFNNDLKEKKHLSTMA